MADICPSSRLCVLGVILKALPKTGLARFRGCGGANPDKTGARCPRCRSHGLAIDSYLPTPVTPAETGPLSKVATADVASSMSCLDTAVVVLNAAAEPMRCKESPYWDFHYSDTRVAGTATGCVAGRVAGWPLCRTARIFSMVCRTLGSPKPSITTSPFCSGMNRQISGEIWYPR